MAKNKNDAAASAGQLPPDFWCLPCVHADSSTNPVACKRSMVIRPKFKGDCSQYKAWQGGRNG
ncbi:MAG: hypothetical protein ACK50D_12035 [Burkholderiales bacterium]